jgi:hypothetical protein
LVASAQLAAQGLAEQDLLAAAGFRPRRRKPIAAAIVSADHPETHPRQRAR